jgi:hypothetical protein
MDFMSGFLCVQEPAHMSDRPFSSDKQSQRASTIELAARKTFERSPRHGEPKATQR